MTHTPTLRLELNPSGKAPLSAAVHIELQGPATIELVCDGGGQQHVLSRQFDAGQHVFPVLGLNPQTSYTLTARCDDQPSDLQSWPLEVGALPKGMPELDVRQCETELREPGYMVFSLGRNPKAIQKYTDFESVVAIDREGKVAWFYQSDVSIMGVEVSAQGTLYLMTTDGRIREIDWLGFTLREWFNPGEHPEGISGAIPVASDKFHHAMCVLPNGNFAAVSIEFREVDGFPYVEQAEDGVSKTQWVAGDTIVEFDPATGRIDREMRMLDILDPRRVGYHVMGPFWDNQGFPGKRDWSHQNSLVYDQASDAYLVTMRHQDACFKIHRDGRVAWILGDAASWKAPLASRLLTPVGEVEMPYHPHDPTLLANGDVMVFNNGNLRALPPKPPAPFENCFSRVSRFRIDEEKGTVEEVWHFGGPEGGLPYTAYLSGARELPATGNVFITCGGILTTEDGGFTDVPPLGYGSVCLLEVIPDQDSRKVFELRIQRESKTDKFGWSVFRSIHLPELYPTQFHVTHKGQIG